LPTDYFCDHICSTIYPHAYKARALLGLRSSIEKNQRRLPIVHTMLTMVRRDGRSNTRSIKKSSDKQFRREICGKQCCSQEDCFEFDFKEYDCRHRGLRHSDTTNKEGIAIATLQFYSSTLEKM